MKRWTKRCLIAAGILACTGLGLCIAGGIMGYQFRGNTFSVHWPFRSVSADSNAASYKNEEHAIAQSEGTETVWNYANVKNLKVDVSYGEVYIQGYDGASVRVETLEPGACSVDFDGSTLTVSADEKSEWYDSVQEQIIRIYVPDKMDLSELEVHTDLGSVDMESLTAEKLKVTVEAGSLYASELEAKDRAEVKVSAGEANLNSVELDNLTASCGLGSVNIEGVLTGKISVDCGAGDMNLYISGEQKDYNYVLKCDVGEVTVGDASYSGISGKHTADVGGVNDLNLNCGVGNIEVVFN